jgi:hypothetical protein
MFKNLITKIHADHQLSKKVRRERKLIDEATERVLNEQRIRDEVLQYLSDNNLLKDGVY